MSKRMVDLNVEDGKVTSIDGFELSSGSSEGGGGSGSFTDISITSAKAESKSKGGGPYGLNWSSSAPLEANTAYDVGYIARVFLSVNFNPISVNNNQICDIVGFTDVTTVDYRKIQFGNVILVLTGIEVTPSANIRDSQYIDITASFYLTYAVVKAGTTGSSVSLDASKITPKLQYILYTLSSTSA